MIGHPSGRLLLERDAYKVNLDAVIEACAVHGTWIELNASPTGLISTGACGSGPPHAG